MTKLVLLLVALASCAKAQYDGVFPLALVGDRPLSVAQTTSPVPMILVPRDELALYSRVHISSVSNTQPLVTCQYNRHSVEAVPAVRVLLRQPLVVNSPESYLPFPSEINVVHEGLRMSVPVGALVVPIPSQTFHGPTVVRVMYAVPAGPLHLQYPIYSKNPVPYPFRPEFGASNQAVQTAPVNKPVATYRPPYSPSSPSYGLPQSGVSDLFAYRRPQPPVVTVLNFPTEIASPETLFYQPPVDENGELGNRNPPEAVIPAGIVQSAQPRPSLQVFLNSKEHPLLQSLRDQSEANKDKVTANSISVGVEAL